MNEITDQRKRWCSSLWFTTNAIDCRELVCCKKIWLDGD